VEKFVKAKYAVGNKKRKIISYHPKYTYLTIHYNDIIIFIKILN